jgi:uncharacterized protein (DUF2141 family)
MYKKYYLSLFLLIIGIGYLSAQTLTVRIENAVIGQGPLMIGVFNDEKTFPNNHFKGEKATVSDTVTIVTFHDLPIGQYAVSVFQDSNNNGKLDTGLFGIPKEKYGFSNDVRRPDFQRSSFNFNGDMTITIRIK